MTDEHNENPDDLYVQLKDGSSSNAMVTILLLRMLETMIQNEPDRFQRMRTASQASVPNDDRPDMDQDSLDLESMPADTVRAILLTAVRDTPEGPVLTSPFADDPRTQRSVGWMKQNHPELIDLLGKNLSLGGENRDWLDRLDEQDFRKRHRGGPNV